MRASEATEEENVDGCIEGERETEMIWKHPFLKLQPIHFCIRLQSYYYFFTTIRSPIISHFQTKIDVIKTKTSQALYQLGFTYPENSAHFPHSKSRSTMTSERCENGRERDGYHCAAEIPDVLSNNQPSDCNGHPSGGAGAPLTLPPSLPTTD